MIRELADATAVLRFVETSDWAHNDHVRPLAYRWINSRVAPLVAVLVGRAAADAGLEVRESVVEVPADGTSPPDLSGYRRRR